MLATLVFLILAITIPLSITTSADSDVNISTEFIGDIYDRNEWGPTPGGEEIQAEWGEPVLFRALPSTPFNRSTIMMWRITDLTTGENEVFVGNQIQVKFRPADRRLDIVQRSKFLVELIVFFVRSNETAARTSIQLWVSSDDDNDNDGLPDRREKYYWGDDIIHHLPELDEDGDGFTNIQEIGFDIPLAYSEMVEPYSPPIGHFDPTDPDSPVPRNGSNNGKDRSKPFGPVMPAWAAYTITGSIASIGLMGILFMVGFIRYSLKDPPVKEEGRSFLEKGGEDRPLAFLQVLENRRMRKVELGRKFS